VVNLPRASVQASPRGFFPFKSTTTEVIVEFTAAFVEVVDEMSGLRIGCGAIGCEDDKEKQQNCHLAQEARWAGPHTGNVGVDNPSWKSCSTLDIHHCCGE